LLLNLSAKCRASWFFFLIIIIKKKKTPKKAPIYLNLEENKGFQKILDDEKYPIDYKLFIEK
jgi:flagellar assembly factor FliW